MQIHVAKRLYRQATLEWDNAPGNNKTLTTLWKSARVNSINKHYHKQSKMESQKVAYSKNKKKNAIDINI